MDFDLVSRLIVEYALNALWQVPLLTLSGWLLVRAARLGNVAEHRLWIGTLAACVVLPLHGLEASQPAAKIRVTADVPVVAVSRLPPVALRLDGPVAAVPTHPRFELSRYTRLHLSARTLRSFGSFYAALVSLAFLRLARAMLGAHRLLHASTAYAMDEAGKALWQELNQTLWLKLPESTVRLSPEISSPVVVGILRPALLLPAGFERCGETEQRAALAHELAHIARRDTLTHALCQALALPLVWHPLVHAIHLRISRTREMICDAIAARSMPSEFAYARCLLSLAQQLLRDGSVAQTGAALGLFRNRKLEDRVIKLTEATPTLTTRERWTRGATAAGALALTGAAMTLIHLTPVLAQTTGQPQPQTQVQPIAPASPVTPPVFPESPARPAAPTHAPGALPATVLAPKPSAPNVQEIDLCSNFVVEGTPAEAVDDKGHPFAIGHGEGGHLMLRHGGYIHRWTGTDGQPWELMNDQPVDPAPQQKRDAEAEYYQKMKQTGQRLDRSDIKLNCPDFKALVNLTTEGEIAKQLEVLKNLPRIKIDFSDADLKNLAELKDLKIDPIPQIKLDMSELKTKQQIDEWMAGLNDPRMAAKMADAEKRLDEASKRLEAATKALEKAQRQLDKTSH